MNHLITLYLLAGIFLLNDSNCRSVSANSFDESNDGVSTSVSNSHFDDEKLKQLLLLGDYLNKHINNINLESNQYGSKYTDNDGSNFSSESSEESKERDVKSSETPDQLYKRSQAYLRFGKSGPAYLRFGRNQAYLRFGKRAPGAYLRFGKRNPAYLRFGRK